MGDQIHPAIYLSRIEAGRDGKFISSALMEVLKKAGKEDAVSKDGLHVEILHQPNMAGKNAIISGINLPFNEIRLLFRKESIGNWLINLREADYGFQREPSGRFSTHAVDMVHKRLKEGQGFFQHHLKVFTADFVTKILGGSDCMEHILFIKEEKKNLDTGMLYSLPGFLQFRTHPKEKREDPDHVDIEFMTRLEAIQALNFLNGNRAFCKTGVRFETVGECKVQPGQGLAREGGLLNISEFMKVGGDGYVPIQEFREGVLDETKIEEQWKSACIFCRCMYNIVGVGPDLDWLAATCICIPQVDPFSWPNERFFRVTFRDNYGMKYEDFEEKDCGVNEKLILFVKGVKPLFNNVDDFRHSAYALEKVEARTQSRIFASQFQSAIVCSEVVVIETKEEEQKNAQGKKIKITKFHYNLQLSTQKSDLWCEEGVKKIGKIQLIRKTDALSSPNFVSLSGLEANLSTSIKGRLHRIVDNGQQSVVELTVWVPEEESLKNMDEFFLLPHPRSGNAPIIARHVRRWEQFETDRDKLSLPFATEITTARTVKVELPFKHHTSWRVSFRVENNRFITSFMASKENQEKFHYGVEMKIAEDGNRRLHGRMTGVKKIDGEDSMVEAVVYFLCKSDFDFNKKPKNTVIFWKGKIVEDLLRAICEPDAFIYEDSAYFIEKPDLKSRSESMLATTVIANPLGRGLELGDLMLSTSNPLVKHEREVSSVSRDKSTFFDYSKYCNDSQCSAIGGYFTDLLHVTEGPPGCGKSRTAAYGILSLHSTEKKKRLSLVLTQTNHAADVMLKNLIEIKEKHNLPQTIMRYVTKDMEGSANSEHCQRYVHNAITSHPHFKDDEEAQRIMNKKKVTQRMVLMDSEVDYLEEHFDKFRRLVIDKVDVLVCTISTAISYKMEEYLKRKDDQLLSVVLDEANLVSVGLMLPILALDPMRLWILGDARQMFPVCTSRTSFIACGDVSWMRLLTATKYLKEKAQMTHLDLQYRMHEDIAKVVSQWMYDSRVKTSDLVNGEARLLKYTDNLTDEFEGFDGCRFHRITYRKRPANFDTTDGTSAFNTKEVDIVEQLVVKLRNGVKDKSKITILSMYAGQLKKIKERIGNDIPVKTTDSYEGQENDFIIVSMVRCNTRNDIGFLRCVNRTLVGISRAKHHVFFISCEDTFIRSRIPDATRLYKILDDNGIKKVFY